MYGVQMYRTVLLLSVSLCAFSAAAQVASPVTVSAEDCQRLVKHTPRDDVTYKPGVDVYGNPVVPADTASDSPFKVPDKITMDLGFDFAGRYGVSGAGDVTSTTDMFTVTYDIGQGAMTVNGQPLSKADSAAIARACAQGLKKPQN